MKIIHSVSASMLMAVIGTYSQLAGAATCPAGRICMTVNSTEFHAQPNGPCTISGALAAIADAASEYGCLYFDGADTILLPGGTIDVSEGLQLLTGVRIIGAGMGNTVLASNGLFTAVAVYYTGSDDVFSRVGTTALQDLSVWGYGTQLPTRGFAVFNSGFPVDVALDRVDVAGFSDGGIFTDGTLAMNYCAIYDNASSTSGGGVRIATANGDVVTISNSEVSTNQAPSGGGVHLESGELVLSYSTIASNAATSGDGGGLLTANFGTTLKAIHNTVAFNSAAAAGGGVSASGGGNVRWDASIFASNTAPQFPDYLGAIRTDPNECLQDGLNKNLIQTLSGSGPLGWNLVNRTRQGTSMTPCTPSTGIGDFSADPLFSTGLVNNGGPTYTLALKRNDSRGRGGSPAINAGVKPADLSLWYDSRFAVDQRGPGFAAPRGNRYDLGAFEAQ